MIVRTGAEIEKFRRHKSSYFIGIIVMVRNFTNQPRELKILPHGIACARVAGFVRR
jgi:hypothetical protein